jgi:hypothetical protein
LIPTVTGPNKSLYRNTQPRNHRQHPVDFQPAAVLHARNSRHTNADFIRDFAPGYIASDALCIERVSYSAFESNRLFVGEAT